MEQPKASASKATLLAYIEYMRANQKATPSEVICYPTVQKAIAGTDMQFEVQARKAGEIFFSQYFASYESAFYKVKALQKAGWKVTRFPRQ
jgi:hypothetical protein